MLKWNSARFICLFYLFMFACFFFSFFQFTRCKFSFFFACVMWMWTVCRPLPKYSEAERWVAVMVRATNQLLPRALGRGIKGWDHPCTCRGRQFKFRPRAIQRGNSLVLRGYMFTLPSIRWAGQSNGTPGRTETTVCCKSWCFEFVASFLAIL